MKKNKPIRHTSILAKKRGKKKGKRKTTFDKIIQGFGLSREGMVWKSKNWGTPKVKKVGKSRKTVWSKLEKLDAKKLVREKQKFQKAAQKWFSKLTPQQKREKLKRWKIVKRVHIKGPSKNTTGKIKQKIKNASTNIKKASSKKLNKSKKPNKIQRPVKNVKLGKREAKALRDMNMQ